MTNKTLDEEQKRFLEVLLKGCGNLEITNGEVIDGDTEPLLDFLLQSNKRVMEEIVRKIEKIKPINDASEDYELGQEDMKTEIIKSLKCHKQK